MARESGTKPREAMARAAVSSSAMMAWRGVWAAAGTANAAANSAA
ncbi:MAG TPA: hypothetical protein VF710_09115 [Longimicrobium sp.]